MRRAALAVIACFAAILVQVTVLDNLPFPGGSPPNLVLLVVVTLALAMGPLPGAVTGFGAGLAADIAPPATHLLGQDALVFCLVGYLFGLLRGPLERSSWLPLGAIAVGVVSGECLYALTGMVFGDPDVTWRAAQHVVPVSVGYEVLLSPFVLLAVARLARETTVMGTTPAGFLTGRGLMPAWGGISIMSGSVRDTGSGRGPRLRSAGADGWIGAMRPQAAASAAARRPPSTRLRLRGGVAGSAAGGSLAAKRPARQAATVNLHLGASRRRSLASHHASYGGKTGPARQAGTKLRGGAFTRGQPSWSAAQVSRPRTAKLRLGTRHGLASPASPAGRWAVAWHTEPPEQAGARPAEGRSPARAVVCSAGSAVCSG